MGAVERSHFRHIKQMNININYKIAIRLLLFVLALYCVTACATRRKAVDDSSIAPLFYGRYELITDKDKIEILDTANKKIAGSSLGGVIENVKVFNSKEVDVTYSANGSPDSALSFELFKINGCWQIGKQ